MPEIFKPNAETSEAVIDRRILGEVVGELLDKNERPEKELLTEAFFWRVIFLYQEKTGFKPTENARGYYEELKRQIAELAKDADRLFRKNVKYAGTAKAEKAEPTPAWLAEEIRREDLNDRGPRLKA